MFWVVRLKCQRLSLLHRQQLIQSSLLVRKPCQGECVTVKPHQQAKREKFHPFTEHNSLKIRQICYFSVNPTELSVWVATEDLRCGEQSGGQEPALTAYCEEWRREPSLWCVEKAQFKWIKIKTICSKKTKEMFKGLVAGNVETPGRLKAI